MVQRLTINWHEEMGDGVPVNAVLACAMPRLRTLSVDFQSRGRLGLPHLWPLQHLTGLTSLEISSRTNDSRGPVAALPWLAHLKQLRALRLNGMHLLPPAVEALHSLSAVTLVNVGISEDAGHVLPPSLAHLFQLRCLELALAGGVDLAAASMTGLACLTRVEVSELGFARGGPIGGLSTLPVLKRLSLVSCDFGAEVGVHSPATASWQLAAERSQQSTANNSCVDAMPRRTSGAAPSWQHCLRTWSLFLVRWPSTPLSPAAGQHCAISFCAGTARRQQRFQTAWATLPCSPA